MIRRVSSAVPGGQQGARVSVAFQDRQVGLAEVAGQRGHRHQLPDQVLDPHLVLAGRPGEPVAGPDPPVQRGRVRAGQLELLQPARVGQRHPGQRLRVDPVRFGMPAQEPAQVRGLGRRHPVDGVTAAGEEHRDRHPRRPGRLEHHRQPRARRRPGQRRPLHRGQRLHRRHARRPAHHLAISLQHPHRMPRRDPQVNPDQAPRPGCPSLLFHRYLSSHRRKHQLRRHSRQQPIGHGPRAQSPATAPIHVLQPAQAPIRAGPLPSCGSSVARPAVAIKSARPGKTPASEPTSSPPTGPAGDAHATLEPLR